MRLRRGGRYRTLRGGRREFLWGFLGLGLWGRGRKKERRAWGEGKAEGWLGTEESGKRGDENGDIGKDWANLMVG